MKIKKKKKSFTDTAYKTTQIDSGRTQSKIQDMLTSIGISKIRFTKIDSDYTVEFIAKLRNDEYPRKVRMIIPINTELEDSYEMSKKRENILFRVLYWHLRDKFIAIKRGLLEFEEAFLPDLVVVSNGKEMRLGDILVPKYKESLKGSPIAVLNIKDESK